MTMNLGSDYPPASNLSGSKDNSPLLGVECKAKSSPPRKTIKLSLSGYLCVLVKDVGGGCCTVTT